MCPIKCQIECKIECQIDCRNTGQKEYQWVGIHFEHIFCHKCLVCSLHPLRLKRASILFATACLMPRANPYYSEFWTLTCSAIFTGRTCAQSLGLCANFRLVCFLRRPLFYVISCRKILFAQASKFRMTDPNFPAELLNWLDGWGGRLKDLVTDGCKQAWATCTATVHSPLSRQCFV